MKCSPHIRGRRGEFAVHHLRAHVLESPTHGHLDLAILRVFQGFGEAEVDDPEVVVVVGVGEHDVERLEVKVEDPLAVDELDSPEKRWSEEKTWWKSGLDSPEKEDRVKKKS